jgi:HJR/Mrr/RecB family endonuclease
VGLLTCGSLALNYSAAVVLYDELTAYQDCSAEAITIAAMDRCSREFEEAARERLREFGVSLSWLVGSDS